MRFELRAGVERALRQHASLALPREACGLLARGLDGAQHYLPMTNTQWLKTCFAIDPVEFARRERELREKGLWIGGFFHSHPRGPAAPSPADTAAAWPRHVQLILGSGGRLTAWYKHHSGGGLRRIPIRASS